jgi:hypothetical protein
MESAGRKNVTLALVVEQGLLIDMVKGSANAWAYMAMNAVPPRVIQRVLIDPARRRPSVSVEAKAAADSIRDDAAGAKPQASQPDAHPSGKADGDGDGGNADSDDSQRAR